MNTSSSSEGFDNCVIEKQRQKVNNFACVKEGHLRRHFNEHSGGKSHKCPQCDYASAHAVDLRTHLKSHSGEKPYIATFVTMHLLFLVV